jgi:uncharacterized protein (TIGR02145 family)
MGNDLVWQKNKPITPIHYGLLYSVYCVFDSRNITPSGWHIPSKPELETLINYLGGETVAGGKLKETGTTYWDSPNTGATNESGFSARGVGFRAYTGPFFYLKKAIFILSSDLHINGLWHLYLREYTATAVIGVLAFLGSSQSGGSLRYIKDDSTDPGTVTGNDGKIYPTVKISNQVWTACNVAETKYRNGDTIPEVTDNSAWAALTTGALCAYNNDWNNV